MSDKHIEWLKQSDYDIETADAMYNSGRYFYAVFMCHLAIEKALKGYYHKNFDQVLPKTHNLINLLNKIGKSPEKELKKFIAKLSTAGVTTRYPDDLEKIKAAIPRKLLKT